MPKQNQEGQPHDTLELPPGVKLVRTLEGHKGVVWSVAFDWAGQMLATGGGDSAVNLWDVASGRLLRTLKGHDGHVNSVAFDPVDQTLASGSRDGTVKLWKETSRNLLCTLKGQWH